MNPLSLSAFITLYPITTTSFTFINPKRTNHLDQVNTSNKYARNSALLTTSEILQRTPNLRQPSTLLSSKPSIDQFNNALSPEDTLTEKDNLTTSVKDFFVSDSFKNAIESNVHATDKDLIKIKTEIKKPPKVKTKNETSNDNPLSKSSLDRDPETYQKAEKIINAINLLKDTIPRPVLSIMIETCKQSISDQCPKGSYTAQIINAFLDIFVSDEDPDGQKEYLYLWLQIAAILDKTSQINDETNKTPVSIYQSLFIDIVEKIFDFIQVPHILEIASKYNPIVAMLAGDDASKNTQNKINNFIDSVKSEILSSLRQEETNSLTTKIKTLLYLFIVIDTGQKVDFQDIAKYFHKLGIISSKVAQTVGGQANNAFFKDGGTKERAIEACQFLQQNGVPMTEEQAIAQMHTYYEKEFGPDWMAKMFKEIDFSNPIRVGTIACVYLGICANNQGVVVKVKKPIEEQLRMEKVQVGQVLHALYEIIQEAVNAFERLDRPVPEFFDKANLFQRSETSTQNFLARFEAELKLENEAQAMLNTKVLTPTILSYTPNAIIMNYIEDGLTPFEYIEIANRSKPTEYATEKNPALAVEGWIQTHYPYSIKSINTISGNTKNNRHHRINVKFNNDIKDLQVTVKSQGMHWHIQPNRPYVDFSPKARDKIAAQNIADLVIQLSGGQLNCDAHAGNFLIAPSNKLGQNLVYNIDFGFTATVDDKESKLAWNFVKGLAFKNVNNIAKSYLDMTERGRTASPQEYKIAVQKFSEVLIETEYTKMLVEEPDQAMGPVMEWLAAEEFNIDAKFYAIIRAFAGVASNAATMQNGRPISAQQIALLSKQLLANQFNL